MNTNISDEDEREKILREYAEDISDVPPDNIESTSAIENVEEKVSNINTNIIKEIEDQKKELREKLTKTVTKFLWVQLLFFNIIVLLIVLSVTIDFMIFKKVNNDLATLLFDFLKYYISATIVELLGMLVFILHYVFSKFAKS